MVPHLHHQWFHICTEHVASHISVNHIWCLNLLLWITLFVWICFCESYLMSEPASVNHIWCLNLLMWIMFDVWTCSCESCFCMNLLLWIIFDVWTASVNHIWCLNLLMWITFDIWTCSCELCFCMNLLLWILFDVWTCFCESHLMSEPTYVNHVWCLNLFLWVMFLSEPVPVNHVWCLKSSCESYFCLNLLLWIMFDVSACKSYCSHWTCSCESHCSGWTCSALFHGNSCLLYTQIISPFPRNGIKWHSQLCIWPWPCGSCVYVTVCHLKINWVSVQSQSNLMSIRDPGESGIPSLSVCILLSLGHPVSQSVYPTSGSLGHPVPQFVVYFNMSRMILL